MPQITSPSILQTKDGAGAVVVNANSTLKFVGCTLVATSPTETEITVGTGTGTWNTVGNAGAGLKLGTTNNNSWVMIANNITWVTLSTGGEFRFMGSGSGYAGFKSPAAGPSFVYTLPTADGSSGQVLSTSGAGVLSWVANGSTSGTANTVAFFGGGGALSSTSTFSWDGTNLGIGVSATDSKAVIHAGNQAISGTVSNGVFIFGRIRTTTRNIGMGTIICGGQTGGGGGIGNDCAGEDCIIGGRNNQVVNTVTTSQANIIWGQNNILNGVSFCSVFGDNNQLTGIAGIGNEGHIIAGVTCVMTIATAVSDNIGNALFGFQNSITDGGGILMSGKVNTASGTFSTCHGFTNICQGYAQLVIGRFNTAQGTANSWVSTDDLFIAGNGTAAGASRANAYVLAKDGKVTQTGAFKNTATRIVAAAAAISARTDYTIIFDTDGASGNFTLPPGEDGLEFRFASKGGGPAFYTLVADGADAFDTSVDTSLPAGLSETIVFKTGTWYRVAR